jgi:hypothetical protein
MGINVVHLDNFAFFGAEQFIGKFCSKTVMGCGIHHMSNQTE